MPDEKAKSKSDNLKKPSKRFKEMSGSEYMQWADKQGL